MKKTLETNVLARLEAITEKRARGEMITIADAMVAEYRKPCCVTLHTRRHDAHGFGVGTLIITRNEIRIVCASEDDGTPEFYPNPGLIRSAILQGSRYPGILAGSRLVRGRHYIQVCTQSRLADEKSLARIINKWRNWVPKAP